MRPYTEDMKSYRSKHVFGQNFVVDQKILEREVAAAAVNTKDIVLEIGAGPGNLTEELLRTDAQVTTIELDKQFSPNLEALQRKYANLLVVWGDALEIKWPRFNKVVANLPYRLAIPIIFKLLDSKFELAVLVIQEDLARRIAARPGQAGYSRISVAVQRVAEIKRLEKVGSIAFSPPPQVDSEMIVLRRKRQALEIEDQDHFSAMLDFMFFHRDEKLGKVLSFLPLGKARSIIFDHLSRILSREVKLIGPREFVFIYKVLGEYRVGIPELSNEQKRRANKRVADTRHV